MVRNPTDEFLGISRNIDLMEGGPKLRKLTFGQAAKARRDNRNPPAPSCPCFKVDPRPINRVLTQEGNEDLG